MNRRPDLAGAAIDDERALGDTAFPIDRPLVPLRSWIDGPWLRCSLRSNETGAPYRAQNPRGMLDAFRQIRDADDVLRFAQRYGVMWMCRHGLPSAHNPPSVGTRGCRPLGVASGEIRESISHWLRLANAVDAFVQLVPPIRDEQPGPDQAWGLLLDLHPGIEEWVDGQASVGGRDPLVRRRALETVINWWLDWGGARWHLNWLDPADPKVSMLTSSTFGVLATQLSLALAGAQDLAVCNGCARAYTRKKRPQSGRRNYCENCRRLKIPERDRQRDHRAL